MIKRTVVLNFPKSVVKEPITYKLVKDFDLMFNILRAKIKPDERGNLIIQLKGSEENMEKAYEYITSIGVEWNALAKGVKIDEKKCIHCTACTSLCPTKALDVDRKTMKVIFDDEKCIACEICLSVCSYNAISMDL